MADVSVAIQRRIFTVIRDLSGALDAPSQINDVAEASITRLEQLSIHLVQVSYLLDPEVSDRHLEALGETIQCLREFLESRVGERHSEGYELDSIQGVRGRPRFDVRREQLEYFISFGFDCPTIAEMLGVSLRTVRRRMDEFQINMRQTYSGLADNELDDIVTEIIREFPHSGYRIVHGILFGKGINVQLARVRLAMQRCDPEGVALRWLTSLHPRCSYSVYGPQALWHIDGNHKLIRSVILLL